MSKEVKKAKRYRIFLRGQTSVEVSHFSLQDAQEHAELLVDNVFDVLQILEIKTCSKCKFTMPLSDFYRKSSYGYESQCKQCRDGGSKANPLRSAALRLPLQKGGKDDRWGLLLSSQGGASC